MNSRHVALILCTATMLFCNAANKTSKQEQQFKQFILYIAHKNAFFFYRDILNNYKGDIDDWKRKKAKYNSIDDTREAFEKTEHLQTLCRVIGTLAKKLNAKPEILTDNYRSGSLIHLSSPERHLLEDVQEHCDESAYIYKVSGIRPKKFKKLQEKIEIGSEDNIRLLGKNILFSKK